MDEELWLKAYDDFFPFWCGGTTWGAPTDKFGAPDFDRIIYLGGDKVARIKEERMPAKTFPNILLEISIDRYRSLPGWINRPEIITDYVAFAYEEERRVYLFDRLLLQRAWFHNKGWMRRYKVQHIRWQLKQPERLYLSVPLDVVFKAYANASFCQVPSREEEVADILDDWAEGKLSNRDAADAIAATA